MTYYEEFGISSSATPDEIRHAHRRLVKILHPDLQTEEQTCKLAETQTRRINGIAQILLHSDQRREYDAGLLTHADRHLHLICPAYTPLEFAVTGLCLLAGLWLILSANPEPDRPSRSPQPTASSIPQPTKPEPKKTPATHAMKTPAPAPQRSSGVPEKAIPPSTDETTQETSPLESPHIALKPASDTIPLSQAPKPDPPLAESTDRIQQAPQAPSGTDNPLIGTWIYVPAPTAEETRKVYRPEYIEMRIRNIPGAIEGQYRARYHVPDRPLSPNVGFRFAGPGPPGAGSAAFRWNGSNGLAGQVQLKLLTANSIQVDWRVTELAESADLVSGSAILTRVQ